MTRTIVTWIGGLALLAATLTDTVAVIGRHVGLPLAGSIELMQAAILVSAAVGLVVATAERTHARVRLVVDRLAASWRGAADRFSDLLTLLFVLALLLGSGWIAVDLWAGHEQSELLRVPWALLRLVANVCLLAVCAILVRQIVRRPR